MDLGDSQTINAPKICYMYYVVEFPDEKIDDEVPMSVISYTWISHDDETGIYTCMWPKRATDTQRMQMTLKHKTPTSFISGIRINIKYKHILSLVTYEKAVSKMKELEMVQSVSQSDTSDVETRKRIIKPKYYDDFTSSVESENDLPTLKLKTKRTNGSKRPKTDIEVLCNTKTNDASQLVHKTFSPQMVVEEPTTSNQERRFKRNTPDITVEGMYSQYNDIDDLSNRTTPLGTPTSSRSSPYNRCTCESNEVLLKKVLITVQSLNNELKLIKQCLSKSDDDIPEESQLMKTFPLTTQEQLESFNDTVKENASELVSFCQLIGGKDVLDTTRRLLAKIVGQNLAETYNWCGKNNKPAFSRLKNIVSFIVGVVRKNKFCKNATQQEVETIIKSWLRTATDRNGGRNRRRGPTKGADNKD